MHPDDLTIEVRDVTLARKALVDRRLWTDVKIIPRFNALGTWSLSLPREDAACEALARPGAGLIVTGADGDVIMSGPMESFERIQTPSDTEGRIEFTGVDDSCILWDALAMPDPASPDDAQTLGYDVRSAACETLLHQLVDVNIGPSALLENRGLLAQSLLMGTDGGRGAVRSSRARFDSLGELLSSLAGLDGLGFRVVQVGDHLEFQTYERVDRSKKVRLDVANGTLSMVKFKTRVPELTRVDVLGQGEGAARTVLQRSSVDAAAAEAEWGRIRKTVKDRRDTDTVEELEQAGDEDLVDGGRTIKETRITPADDIALVYGRDWREGDIVSVVVGDDPEDEIPQTVTSAGIAISSAGVLVAAKVGE